MLSAFIFELDRLITKYSASPWNAKITANKLVSLLTEHRALIQEELDDVLSGRRVLTETDFLGPEERRKLKLKSGEKTGEGEEKDYTQYFMALDEKILEIRRTEMRKFSSQKRKEAKEAADPYGYFNAD